MQLKLSKGQWIEAAMLAPTTFAFASALPFGIVFITLTLAGGLAIGLAGGSRSFLAALYSARELIVIWMMMVAAAAGLGALWLTVLMGREWVLAQARRRRLVVLALMAGLTAGVYWFVRLAMPEDNGTIIRTVILWEILILLPSPLAVRYLCVLFRPLRLKSS
jgi:hypothetical protein